MKAPYQFLGVPSIMPSYRSRLVLVTLIALVSLGGGAFATPLQTGVAREAAVLAGPKPSLCADLMGRADYAGGTDATGHPVIPAEGLDAPPPLQVPGETVLVRRSGVEIPVQLRGLNAGLAASNACPPLRLSPEPPSHPQ